MYSPRGTAVLPAVGFPIRTSTDQSLVGGSPWLFAATHVLLRLLEPRHPPHTLSSLVTLNSDPPSVTSGDAKSRSRSRPSNGLHLAKTSLCDALLTLRIRLSMCFVCAARRASRTRGPAQKRCGADRSRTDDIQLAKLALYHLSYSPNKRSPVSVVGPGGFEPPTSRLSGVRSSQLSYGPKQPDRLRRLPHDAFQRTESARSLETE